MPTRNIKDNSNNYDKLSSDVDIAPSGIVTKGNNDLQCQIINSDSDEGNLKLQDKSDGDICNKST